MLNFVDISKELSYQQKDGIPSLLMGIEYALKDSPLDFQYAANEAISSFSAIRVNGIGEILETFTLSTSLITYDSVNGLHKCDGLTNYSTALDCGYYYFSVNGRYQSEYFKVLSIITESTSVNEEISLSGLKFHNINNDIPDLDKAGTPMISFGEQYALNTTPLDFKYLANEAISTFEAIKVDNLGNIVETINLSTSLITYDSVNGVHNCDGLTDYATNLDTCKYYFLINSKFRSDIFQVVDLTEVGCIEWLSGGCIEWLSGESIEWLT